MAKAIRAPGVCRRQVKMNYKATTPPRISRHRWECCHWRGYRRSAVETVNAPDKEAARELAARMMGVEVDEVLARYVGYETSRRLALAARPEIFRSPGSLSREVNPILKTSNVSIGEIPRVSQGPDRRRSP